MTRNGKAALTAYSMFAMLAATTDNFKIISEDITPLPKEPKVIIPKGCKVFIIDGKEIVSLSLKRAKAKYKRLYEI
jgi:hypothetical protein